MRISDWSSDVCSSDLFGQDVSTASRSALPMLRRRIGVVFQDFRLLDHLTALDNVALPLRIAGADAQRTRDHAIQLLTWVGPGDRPAARPATLSAGEKQCVPIPPAAIARPTLLLPAELPRHDDPEMDPTGRPTD